MIKKTIFTGLLTAALAGNLAHAAAYQMQVSAIGVRASISLALSTNAIAFGTVGNGSTTVKPLTVTNTGMGPARLILGASSGPYTLGRGACATTLAPGQQCNLTVTFSPTSSGPSNTSLQVSAEGATTASTVAVTGNSVSQAQSVALANGQGFSIPAGATDTSLDFNSVGSGTARWYLYRDGALVAQSSYSTPNSYTTTGLGSGFSSAVLIPGYSYSFRLDGFTLTSATVHYTY